MSARVLVSLILTVLVFLFINLIDEMFFHPECCGPEMEVFIGQYSRRFLAIFAASVIGGVAARRGLAIPLVVVVGLVHVYAVVTDYMARDRYARPMEFVEFDWPGIPMAILVAYIGVKTGEWIYSSYASSKPKEQSRG